MTLSAWRIVPERHIRAAFSGEGARRFGGRWNPPGMALVYTAATASLAVLELLVQLPSAAPLQSYVCIPVDLEETDVEILEESDLPGDWAAQPAPASTRGLGAGWLREARSLAWRVPSVIVPWEYNYLINPTHPDARRLRVGLPRRWQADPRLGQPR